MNPQICNNCGGTYEFRNGRWKCRSCGSYKPEESFKAEETVQYKASPKPRTADKAKLAFDDSIRNFSKKPDGHVDRSLTRYGIKSENHFDEKKIPTSCHEASEERMKNGFHIVTLVSQYGENIDFIDIAGIPYKGHWYAILQPLNLLEGMEDDETLVFEVTSTGEEDKFQIVLDDATIDAVFDIYYKQCK